MGTNCQNQPEVHELLQALPRGDADRGARRSPSRPRRSSPRATSSRYLGAGRHEGKECDLAYHNSLMVLLWSALASGRVALLTHTLRAMPPVPPGAGWVTYVRCHDDIGWAITEEDAGRGRARTATCTAASWPTSTRATSPARFARGARFQPDPLTGEARTSGTDGVAGRARGGARERRRARRWSSRSAASCCSTRVAFAHGGLPLVYMGDELGLRNDHA